MTQSAKLGLSFDYRLAGTFSAGQGYYVQASADGNTWTTVATLGGAQSSTYKHFALDLSDFISAQTKVRIVEFGTSNTAYFDNFKIEYGTRVSYYRLEWTGVAPAGATIATGQRVALTVTDTSTNSEPFQVQYDSQTKPSLVQLAADRIINVDNLAVYTLPYPGGVVTTNGDPNTVVYVRTTVSDPFGAYDITSLDLAFAPSGTVGTAHLTVANVVASTTGTKTYELAWNTGPMGTNYTIAATAAEGTEGMKTVSFSVFGVKPMGNVAGAVFLDQNGDGVPDATDTNSLVGVVVMLKSNGTVVATTTTDAAGRYVFTNLVPGAYTIFETDPAGYTSTLPANNTLAVTVLNGQTVTGYNFYDTQPGSISGSVRVDVDGDGIAEAADTTGIAGVTVTLKNAGGMTVASTTTTASGTYLFVNVMPGSYTVVETDLPGYASTTDRVLPNDNRIPLTLASGQVSTENNFFDTQYASVSGKVRVDANGNGVADPTDTNGIASVTVSLKNAGGAVVATVPTDAAGYYLFANVLPGAYTIVESDLAGYTSTLPVNNTLAVTLVSGTASTGNNFYDTLPGTVRGSVLVDLNGDGIVQTGDTNAIAGVAVTLKQGSTVVATTTTDAQGGYSFTNVMPGSYTVVESDLAGYSSTLPVDNTDAVTVTADSTATALFYDTQKTAISGNVRLDVNGNGVVDAADTNGIAVVAVTLKQGSTVVATTTTSASGAYSFTNVLPGAYTVVETDLAGYTSTLPVNNTLAVTLVSGTASTGNNFYDTLPGTVRGSVLVDLNGDGIVQTGDTNAIAGVTVTLKQGSTVIGTTTTDAQGGYSFTNVMPGAYTVVETDLAGYSSTLPVDNTDAVTVTAGSTATALFYDTQKTAISGNVRLDVNGNGVVDSADTNGIAVVAVTLKQGSTVVATTTTSASGAYSFTNVLPGAYTIVESDLAGYTSTLPVNNTLAVTLVSGVASTGNNFYDAVLTSGVRIVKTAGSAPDGSAYVLSAAGPVTYTYVVSNIGNTYLNSVTVTDDKLGAIGNAAGILAPGASVTMTATATLSASVTNVGTVTAHPTDAMGGNLPGVTNVTATDTAVVLLAVPNETCDPLGIATNFNAMIFGDFAAIGGDTEGRLAIAGTARITNGYSVGISTVGEPVATATGNVDRLIVGADFYDRSWGINGNIVYGGTRYGPVRYSDNNTVRRVNPVTFNAFGNVPNDGSGVTFPVLLEQLRATSSALGALADQGVMTKTRSTQRFKLTGTNAQLNVFNVQAQDWTCSQSDIVIAAPAGSTVLVNIHGASASLSNGTMRVTGVVANNILFNYVDATELATASFDHKGSVLAPYANAHLHSGQIEGSAVFGGNVATETGFEFHNFPFRGHVCVDVETPGAGAGYSDNSGNNGDGGTNDVGNIGVITTSAWKRADFAVMSLALVNPPTLGGDLFGAQVTVANRGEIAGDAGRLDVYVSQREIVAAGTVGDATLAVGVLQPGESRTFEFANLKADDQSGTHHLRAFVNSAETTPEWSFGDNQLSTTYKVSAITMTLGFTSDGVQLSWNSFWGQKYSLYRSALPTGPYVLIQEHIKATPPTNSFQDAKQPGMAFYRLKVEQ